MNPFGKSYIDNSNVVNDNGATTTRANKRTDSQSAPSTAWTSSN